MKEILRLRKYFYKVDDKNMMGYIGVAIGLNKKFRFNFTNYWNIHEEYYISISLGFLIIGMYREWEELNND